MGLPSPQACEQGLAFPCPQAWRPSWVSQPPLLSESSHPHSRWGTPGLALCAPPPPRLTDPNGGRWEVVGDVVGYPGQVAGEWAHEGWFSHHPCLS